MTNIFRFLFLFLLTSNTLLLGQNDSSNYKRDIGIGFIGGANHFNFWKTVDAKPDFITGLSAGFHLQNNFSRHFSVIAEFTYDNKKYNDPHGPHPGKAVELEYYSLPIMIRGHIGKRNLFFLNAGTFVSFIIITNSKSYEHGGAMLSTIDAGGIIGAGFRIPLAKKLDLTIEGRESFSILLGNFPGHDNKSVRSNTSFILLGVSYKFQPAPKEERE